MTDWVAGKLFMPGDRVKCQGPDADFTGTVTSWGSMIGGDGIESVEVSWPSRTNTIYDNDEWWDASSVDLIARKQVRNFSDDKLA